MAHVPVERPCPRCGGPLAVAAVQCPHCRGQVGVTRPADDIGVADFLVPRKVSGFSVAAFFFGLIGLFPLIGFFFAVPGLIFAIIALLRKRQGVTYGSVTSDIRAVLGLIMAGIGTVVWGIAWIYVWKQGC